jgi:cytochrome c553
MQNRYLSTAPLFALSVALLCAQPANADEAKNTLRQKIAYCSYCHGRSGRGYRAYYVMPSLAGQTVDYTVNQLKAYADRRRRNSIMFSVARSLSPSMRLALAEHFNRLSPRPASQRGGEHVTAGRRIFQQGLPESNVPACAACHGLQAEGFGQNPRLAGQLRSYVEKTLRNWDRERGHGAADPSHVMQPVAQVLSRSQISSVAAYLASLR